MSSYPSLLKANEIGYIQCSRMKSLVSLKIDSFRSGAKQRFKAMFETYYRWLELHWADDPEMQRDPDDTSAPSPRAGLIFFACIVLAVLSAAALFVRDSNFPVQTWLIALGFSVACIGCAMVMIPCFLKKTVDRIPDVAIGWSSFRVGQTGDVEELIRTFSIPPRFHEMVRDIVRVVPHAYFSLQSLSEYSGGFVGGTKIKDHMKIMYLEDTTDLSLSDDERVFAVCFW